MESDGIDDREDRSCVSPCSSLRQPPTETYVWVKPQLGSRILDHQRGSVRIPQFAVVVKRGDQATPGDV